VWFVKIKWGINGWSMVCMGNGAENRSMVAHDRANGDENYEV
jgi:hypothetical protein